MQIEEFLQVCDMDNNGNLIVDSGYKLGIRGEPLVRNWTDNHPQVVGTFGWKNASSHLVFHCGGDGDDTWLTWLGREFGNRNVMDRFQGVRTTHKKNVICVESFALQPESSPFSYFSDDCGPSVGYRTTNCHSLELQSMGLRSRTEER